MGVTGLRLVSRQKGTHAESSFLQRGFSCQKLLTNPYLSEHHSVSVGPWTKVCLLELLRADIECYILRMEDILIGL